MAKKQLHKYHRIVVAGNKVWACALSDCTHYMPKHMEDMVLGKKSMCWQCDKVFILDNDAMQEDKPRCIECRLGKSDSETDPALLAYLETIPKD
jgi:hypothetical protein